MMSRPGSRFTRCSAVLAIVVCAMSTSSIPPRADAERWSRQMLGVATVATMLPGTDIGREVDAIAAVGVNAIRISVKWNLIEPDLGGQFRWDAVDLAVRTALDHKLQILMTLEGPAPRWAQDPATDPAANGNPPFDARDFGTFANAAASRYLTATSCWEIWNEPNVPHYLDPPTVDTYLPLLREASDGIRRSGSVAPIVTGGTSSNLVGMRDIDFVQELYARGAGTYFDGIAVHPYTYPLPLSFTSGLGTIVPQIRQVMHDHGDDHKQVWITEYGQPTGNTPVSSSELDQAAKLKDAVTNARGIPWIGGFFIFNTVDLAPDSSDPDMNFGLYRYDFTPKPAVAAVRSAVVTDR